MPHRGTSRRNWTTILLAILLIAVVMLSIAVVLTGIYSTHAGHAVLFVLPPIFLFASVLFCVSCLASPSARAAARSPATSRPALFQLPPPQPIA